MISVRQCSLNTADDPFCKRHYIAYLASLKSEYSGTWKLGTPKGLSETVLHSEVVLFPRSISM